MEFEERNSIFTYAIDWSKCEKWEDVRDIMSLNGILIVDYAVIDNERAKKIKELERRGLLKIG